MYASAYFALPYYANADFATRLHYVYDYVYVYVYVYDLKRERDTRTADKPPSPQLFTFLETGFFRIRHYRSGEKKL